MSIKAIHIILISCAVLLSAAFAVWSFAYSKDTGDQAYFNVGIVSVIVAVGLLFYGIHFFKKAKAL